MVRTDGMQRRSRLAGSGRLLIAGAVALLLWGTPATAQSRLDGLRIFDGTYPRAFYFRQTEGAAASGALTYEAWEARFSLLDGIIGKCLDEEVPGRAVRNAEYFSRYRERNPEKLVLLHFNGNSRDPCHETAPYHAGHWLYHNGCRLESDLAAEDGLATVRVADPSLFALRVGLDGEKHDQIGICRLDADGKPDWSVAEHVDLVAINLDDRTLVIRRGELSAPRVWKADEAYIAAHVVEGPWGPHSNLMWSYNYATVCPRDAEGMQCADRLLDDLARWFGPDGPLAAFDGLEFDVLFRIPLGGSNVRGADVDADGVRDDGVLDGEPVYEQGVLRFLARLRERLGADRLILADGHEEKNQRAVPYLSGIESEGWPHLRDIGVADWSGGLNRHGYWQAHAHAPRFSYINHKYVERLDMVDTPLHITRLVMAAAVFTDSAFTYAMMPPAGPNGDVYDELVMGEERRPRWLGRPLGAARALALEAEPLRAGPELAGAWQAADGARLSTDASGAIAFQAEDGDHATIRLEGVSLPGRDLLVSCVVRADQDPRLDPGVPRLIKLHAQAAGQLITAATPDMAIAPRGEVERPIDPPSPLFRHWPTLTIGEERHGAYMAHPPYGPDGPGYLVWERATRVPEEEPLLRFHTGLRPSKSDSDGVLFRIEVRDGDAVQEVFRALHTELRWEAHAVDLGAWAGRTVSLRFITDCGPDDNPTSDHACWGDVFVATAGQTVQRGPDTPGSVMTWAGEDAFASRFYFRDIGPGPVDLAIEAEGGMAVRVADCVIYCAPDLMVRAFEHGVVLANPSSAPADFDLAALFPRRSFRRLRGGQDPAVNSGEPVGAMCTVPPRDALFLAATEE